MSRSVLSRILGTLGLTAATLVMASALFAVQPIGRPTAPRALPPNASPHGLTLQQWMEAYMTWLFSTNQGANEYAPTTPTTGIGNIVFLPMPGWGETVQTGGSWTPDDPAVMVGKTHIVLKAGTGFMTPFWSWTGERYDPALNIPDDHMIFNSKVEQVAFYPGKGPGTPPAITLDGQPLVSDFWAYYVGPWTYDPFLVYPTPTGYGAIGAIASQGPGAVVPPLPVGTHTLKVYEQLRLTPDALPGVSAGVVYDNTWTIDVVPAGKIDK